MSMRIITGSTGNNHVTSDDDRQFNAAIFGADSVVLPQGKRFEATLVDNNTINIADGEVVMQGCHARLNTGTTEDVVIETGAIGKQRIDLIVARYQLDTGTGFESVSLVVVKGVESTSNPAIPIINDNTSLRDGDTILDFALYKVMIDGINIDSVTPMFTPIDYVMGILDTNAEQIAAINSNLIANDGLNFRFATDGEGNYGYLGADDSFIPFRSGTPSEFDFKTMFKGYVSNGQTLTVSERGTYFITSSIWSYNGDSSSVSSTVKLINERVLRSASPYNSLQFRAVFAEIGDTIRFNADSSGGYATVVYIPNKKVKIVGRVFDNVVNDASKNTYTYNGNKYCVIAQMSISNPSGGSYELYFGGGDYGDYEKITWIGSALCFGKKGTFIEATHGSAMVSNAIFAYEIEEEPFEYLYKDGKQSVAWDNSQYAYNSSNPFKGTLTFETSDIKLVTAKSNRSLVSVLTLNKVDISEYSKLRLIYSINNSENSLILDVSSISGNYYVAICADYQGSAGYLRIFVANEKNEYAGNSVKDIASANHGELDSIYIHKVWLEK